MAKDKKKRKKDKPAKLEKQAAAPGKAEKRAKAKSSDKPAKSGASSGALKALAQNPLVADVVAAALVGMASALKDPKKARKLASDGGEEIDRLAKPNGKQGSALWDMALQIGRESLEVLAVEGLRAASASKRAPKKPGSDR